LSQDIDDIYELETQDKYNLKTTGYDYSNCVDYERQCVDDMLIFLVNCLEDQRD